MQYDVFISYSRKDIAAAETLCRALDEAGVKYWIDRNIHGSVNFLSEITSYIRNAKAVLFIASDNSAKSEWTQKEILYALKHKKAIIPYRLGKFHFEENEELDFVFTNVQWIDSLEAVVDTLQKLGLTHQKRVVPPTPPTPPTPPQPTEPRRPKWLWALALMPLLLIGLWFGFRDYFGEQEEVIEKIYRVGDYYDDGIKQGVVFEVDSTGLHGKIVSLAEAKLQWCTEAEYKQAIKIGTTDKENGQNNQTVIEQITDWRTKYPAFAWCADQGEGWYFPAIDELKIIFDVSAAVTRMLQQQGGGNLSEPLWSSTEENQLRGWRIKENRSHTYSYDKLDDTFVRAVTTF